MRIWLSSIRSSTPRSGGCSSDIERSDEGRAVCPPGQPASKGSCWTKCCPGSGGDYRPGRPRSWAQGHWCSSRSWLSCERSYSRRRRGSGSATWRRCPRWRHWSRHTCSSVCWGRCRPQLSCGRPGRNRCSPGRGQLQSKDAGPASCLRSVIGGDVLMGKFNPVTDYLEEYGRGPMRDELEKQAGFGDWYRKQAPVTRRVIEGAGLFVAGQLASEAYGGIRGAVQKAHGFRSMLKHNPALEKHDRKKVHAIYSTLHNVSPDLAKDPVVASSWVNRMMYQDEYVDPRTMSDLATAQQRMSQSRQAFDPYKFTEQLQRAEGKVDLFGGPPAPPTTKTGFSAGQSSTTPSTSGPSGGAPSKQGKQQANRRAGQVWGNRRNKP